MSSASDVWKELFPDRGQIEFLIERRFGRLPSYPDGRVGVGFRTYSNMQEAVAAYRTELMEMDSEKREALYRDELTKQQERERAEADLAERNRFFNEPGAVADVDHGCKTPYWSLDEATALSFGREPGAVKWENVKEHAKVSPFARKYEKLRDLILRAHAVGQLDERVLPGDYVVWAKRNDIDFPADLEAAVVAHGVQIVDWETKHDELNSRHQALAQQFESEQEIKNDLRTRIVELEATLDAAPKPDLGFHGKERESVLKLIIGMALGGYGYDPRRSRSDAVAVITSDLTRAGVELSDDTVRKWLKQAAELLPQTEQE
jgi:hypothetical protein